MASVGVYTPEVARMVLEVVRYLKASGFVVDKSRGNSQFIPPEALIYIRNDTSEEIPPFACLQATGTVESGGQNYITVEKPADTDGTAGWFLFNGFAPIESGGYGIAYDGPLCRMLTDGSTVTAGQTWGPVVGQFAVAPGGELFVAAGEDDIKPDVMRGFFKGGGGGGEKFAAKLNASLGSGTATGTEFYSLNGMTLTYVETATLYDPLFVYAILGSGDWLYCFKQGGKYYAEPGNCPGSSPLIDTPPESGPPGEGV